MKDKKFEILYNRVFDENDNIKNCGREACTELIEYVEEHFNVEVGRENRGIIENKDLIINLYKNSK